MSQSRHHHMSNGAIVIVMGLLYVGLLCLSAWQTSIFVNFLFPSDQLLMKLLTLISFDIMALVWGATDLFYHFASRGAKAVTKWGWAITNLFSLIASVLCLILQSMFRFKVEVSQDVTNVGYAITIIALMYNIISIMFFLYLEYNARHPHQDDFEEEEEIYIRPVAKREVVQIPETSVSSQSKNTEELAPVKKKRDNQQEESIVTQK